MHHDMDEAAAAAEQRLKTDYGDNGSESSESSSSSKHEQIRFTRDYADILSDAAEMYRLSGRHEEAETAENRARDVRGNIPEGPDGKSESSSADVALSESAKDAAADEIIRSMGSTVGTPPASAEVPAQSSAQASDAGATPEATAEVSEGEEPPKQPSTSSSSGSEEEAVGDIIRHKRLVPEAVHRIRGQVRVDAMELSAYRGLSEI
jgi:hypothetical protein